MQYPSRPLRSPESADSPPRAGELLTSRDVVALLQLMGTLASLRNDPRNWRLELLTGLNQLLQAAAGAAFILKHVNGDGASPALVSLFDVGFKSDLQRQAFLKEFNTAPFRDPLSKGALERFVAQQLPTFTCLRSEMVDDRAWNADLHVHTYRKATGTGDCIISLHRGNERGAAYAIYLFRAAISEPSEGAAAPGEARAGARFGLRERLLLDTMHRGLDWLYRAEEATHKMNRASALPPRLRQTLEFLLAGDTERQVALKMSLSVHTVHDYVKALYVHFGVSSRSELLSKWMQTSGQMPRKE